MTKITNSFIKKCKQFKKLESRASIYEFALEIVNTHPAHACMILLATWNAGRFRVVSDKEQFLAEFKKALKLVSPFFKKVGKLDFKSANFDMIKRDVSKIYNTLSKVRGVEYTGASKVMHLINKKLFVMWDNYIRGGAAKKHYLKLHLPFKRYKISADGYIEFLKDMQERYSQIKTGYGGRTLAKCIDENNYVTYTLPIQRLENKKKSEARWE